MCVLVESHHSVKSCLRNKGLTAFSEDGVLADCLVVSSSVPGQPGKFKVGRVTDTSIELTWEPAYTKEGIVNYELLYKPVKFGSLVRPLTLFFSI